MKKFRFDFHTVCVVCFSELPIPEQRGSEGEHVFPKNVFGFWKSYDVCEACKKYFGDFVDNLPLSNPHLINALDEIGRKSNERIQPNVLYNSKDKITGELHKMIRRGAKYIPKTKIGEESIICPESDAFFIGQKWALQSLSNLMSEKEIINEFKALHDEYLKIDTGKFVRSERLGITMRKGSTTGITFDLDSTKSITPLIAKIATIFMAYVFNFDQLKMIDNYYEIRDHARKNRELSPNTIFWNPRFKEPYCDRFHYVALTNFGVIGFLDVSFFRSANWCVRLNYKEKIELLDEDDKEIDEVGFVQYFDGVNRMVFFVKYRGEESYSEYEVISND